MSRFFQFCCLGVLVAGLCRSVSAQNGTPTVTISQAGADRLLEDLEYITNLAGDQGKAQWPNVKASLEIFLEGVDSKKPMRVDILLDAQPPVYRSSFPVGKFADFQQNLVAYEFVIKKTGTANFFDIAGEGFKGFMLFANGYATIAERKADLPLTLPDPRLDVAPLLAKGFDLAASIGNTADGVQSRRDAMQRLRAELLPGIKQKKDEEETDFQLRKQAVENQLDEVERFFVESAQLSLGWTTDVPQKEGRLELVLSALPDTSLAQSIQQIGQSRSVFGNIARSPNAILSARINHPLDDFRKGYLLKLLGLGRDSAKNRFDRSESRNADEKSNSKNMVDLLVDMFVAGTNKGVIDGFIEIQQDEQLHRTLTGGIKADNGKALLDVLALWPKSKSNQSAKLNVAEVGGASLHEVSVPESCRSDFAELFGKEAKPELLVGTSEQVVWVAAGHEAQAALTAAIEKAAEKSEETPNPVFVDFYVKVGPWIELLDANRKEADAVPETDVVKQDAKKKQLELRKSAIETFKPGDDVIRFKLERVEDHVEGGFHFHEGILRFVGKQIATFSEKNLAM